MDYKATKYQLSLIISFLFCLILTNKIFSNPYDFTYFFAAGENNEIEIIWDYAGERDDLLGCNLFRSEEDTWQFNKVNSDLITSTNKDFYYNDTVGIIDTLRYFYCVQYVFPDVSTYAGGIGSFKKIIFEVLDEENIDLLLIPRKTGDYIYNLLVDYAYAGAGDFIDSMNLVLNPYILELYGFLYSWEIFRAADSTYSEYHGFLDITVDYLFALLQSVGLKEYDESDLELLNVKVFPNPFIHQTNFELQLKKSPFIDFSIYDISGHRVKTIYQGNIEEGKHKFSWEGTNEKGIRMKKGIYIYKIKSHNGCASGKLIMHR
ncbi:MAG: T9SS type A sorting domain-containing protein [Bacteroidales bacterium]|nr:T9SS type A sorting domain-containing protein [Bacteroidales bacterium]